MYFSYFGGIVGKRNGGIGQLGAQEGLECKRLQVKQAFLCTHTMGVFSPPLHKDSTGILLTYFHS